MKPLRNVYLELVTYPAGTIYDADKVHRREVLCRKNSSARTSGLSCSVASCLNITTMNHAIKFLLVKVLIMVALQCLGTSLLITSRAACPHSALSAATLDAQVNGRGLLLVQFMAFYKTRS